MNRNKKAKVIATRSLVAALSVVIGLLVTAQWHSVPARVTNPIAPYTSLKDTRESLYREQAGLKAEIQKLQSEIEKAQKEVSTANLAPEQLAALQQAKAKAGLTKLNGPGVIVSFNDSASDNITEDSIIHAADLRDTVNLLWASGAEAIAINGQRVVNNTAIDCIVNTVLINNTRISNPYRIEAIGNKDILFAQLSSPVLLSDLHRRKQESGLQFTVKKNNDITVPVFDGSFEVKSGS